MSTHLNALAVAMLLLKGHKTLVDRVRLVLGYVVQGISVDGARSVVLFAALLKLRKLDEQLLLQASTPECYNSQAATPHSSVSSSISCKPPHHWTGAVGLHAISEPRHNPFKEHPLCAAWGQPLSA